MNGSVDDLVIQMLKVRRMFRYRLRIERGLTAFVSSASTEAVRRAFIEKIEADRYGSHSFDIVQLGDEVFTVAGIPVYADSTVPDGIIEIRNEDHVLNYSTEDDIQIQQAWHYRVQVTL